VQWYLDNPEWVKNVQSGAYREWVSRQYAGRMSRMKILLLGKNGQVGWELQRSLAPLGELVALGSRGEEGGLAATSCNPIGWRDTVRAVRPDVIVNAAAYTAVDKAESEPRLARMVNATAPGVLARGGPPVAHWLVHYSTDYVFDGSGSGPGRKRHARRR
jgi:dTDP-4-dehydrorhamnose reductase